MGSSFCINSVFSGYEGGRKKTWASVSPNPLGIDRRKRIRHFFSFQKGGTLHAAIIFAKFPKVLFRCSKKCLKISMRVHI